MPRQKIDYSGQLINGSILNRRIADYLPPGGSRGLARYNCTCTYCSKEYDTMLSEQKHRKFPGCGCLYQQYKHEKRPDKIHNVTDQRFGRCIAKKRLENGDWLCLCDCGNWFSTSLSHLITGHTKSCGCFRVDRTREKNFVDLTGKIFNDLIVVKYLYSKKFPGGKKASVWLCWCKCGAYTKVLASELTTGGTKSCGCLHASKRELEIRKYLKEHNVQFMPEYSFKDLKLKQPLRFDFALFDNAGQLSCVIEHHGQQHFEILSKKTVFGKQQRDITDPMKQVYCSEKNIPLYIIDYSEDIPTALNKIIAELHVNTVPSIQKIV